LTSEDYKDRKDKLSSYRRHPNGWRAAPPSNMLIQRKKFDLRSFCPKGTSANRGFQRPYNRSQYPNSQ